MTNHCPIYESTSLEQSVIFFENFKIGWRYWWVPDRGAIDKIGNEKKVIQNDESLRRSMLKEVTVDDPNGLTNLRPDRLDVRRPW